MFIVEEIQANDDPVKHGNDVIAHGFEVCHRNLL
jgi:hypothetical protein